MFFKGKYEHPLHGLHVSVPVQHLPHDTCGKKSRSQIENERGNHKPQFNRIDRKKQYYSSQ